MDKTARLGFAKRIREISYNCFDLGAAERLRLLADEMQSYEDTREPARQEHLSDVVPAFRRSL